MTPDAPAVHTCLDQDEHAQRRAANHAQDRSLPYRVGWLRVREPKDHADDRPKRSSTEVVGRLEKEGVALCADLAVTASPADISAALHSAILPLALVV